MWVPEARLKMEFAIEDYMRVVDMIPLPAFLADQDGRIKHANESFSEVSGRQPDTSDSRTLYGLGLFNNAAEYRGFLRSFRNSWAPRRLIIRGKEKWKSNRQLLLQATIVGPQQPVEDQLLCGTLKIYHPSNLLNSVTPLSNIQLMYAVVTEDLRVLEVSNLLRRELGYAGGSPIRYFRQLDAESTPEREEGLQQKLQRGGRPTLISMVQRTDGSLLPCRFEFSLLPPSPPHTQTLFFVTLTDLSDLRALELKYETLREQTLQSRQRAAVENPSSLPTTSPPLVTTSQPQQELLAQIKRVAPTDTTVLIQGETGTGKELIARSIHRYSQRANRPLVVVNCGALPTELIESELFGYRKGAFTGATVNRPGMFEQAHGGTIFLDEIGELPLPMQTRLLRVLQEGTINPLGAIRPLQVDARVIAATNQDLAKAVREGNFRSDLFFRLNVVPIRSIPLRERPEDIPALVNSFIERYGVPTNGELPQVAPGELQRLTAYSFPGNVRELENLVQRALVHHQAGHLQLSPFIEPSEIPDLSTEGDAASLAEMTTTDTLISLEELQRRYISHVLRLVNGKVSGAGGAAEILQMNPQTLFSRMRKLEISR